MPKLTVDFLHEIDAAATTTELTELIRSIPARGAPITHASFTLWCGHNLSPSPDWRASNFPAGFHHSYERRDDMLHNPVALAAMQSSRPVHWQAMTRKYPDLAERYIAHNRSFGVGAVGLSIPAHGRGGGFGVMHLDFAVATADWERHHPEWYGVAHRAALHIRDRLAVLNPGRARRTGLTSRELDVLRHAAHGLPGKAIAALMHIDPQTVSFHLGNVRAKLKARNTVEAAVRAAELGLLSEDPLKSV